MARKKKNKNTLMYENIAENTGRPGDTDFSFLQETDRTCVYMNEQNV